MLTRSRMPDTTTFTRHYAIQASEASTTVWLYDVIGEDLWGGVPAKTFVKDLADIRAPVIHLRINSPGGDVFDARAMVTALREHPARIIAHIDGLAASAASYVALACDEVEMAEGAFLMIHNAWGAVVGNRHELLDMAETLEKIDASIVSDYETRTAQSATTIRQWMDAETWFTASEALDANFIDRIATTPTLDVQHESRTATRLAGTENSRLRRVAMIEHIA